ncbi:YlzJ-like family protein [Alicyclobacillus dauci]|uniref:YlzJ-like family protein n=1 Tax=Alicyclobacillus dauci TaxID=1475485 RepID=A0ABY6YXX5_9BACL|nr:YlzJ-like family protein [Alicyclobacillus dauci]WAH35350.1 YlzJ-like family protein [Alicyclobacillus dauci]
MHWTILSDYEIFASNPPESSAASRTEEIRVGDALLIVERTVDGHATIQRVISPKAADYLRAEWQPGMPYQG